MFEYVDLICVKDVAKSHPAKNRDVDLIYYLRTL